MAHEFSTFAVEGGVAEHVIGMHVGVDHVLDRLVRDFADCSLEGRADARAAAGVDDRHARIADHERRIGDVALIFRVHEGVNAFVDIDARCDLFGRVGDGADGGVCGRFEGPGRHERKACCGRGDT